MVGKAHKLHGTKTEFNSVFGLKKVDGQNPIRTSAIFLGFSNHEKGALREETSK
jgi:hypothetical protein